MNLRAASDHVRPRHLNDEFRVVFLRRCSVPQSGAHRTVPPFLTVCVVARTVVVAILLLLAASPTVVNLLDDSWQSPHFANIILEFEIGQAKKSVGRQAGRQAHRRPNRRASGQSSRQAVRQSGNPRKQYAGKQY